ncbi:WD repeat protein [Ichthyophthirius multifiliis]|uniref:WD repeat protein n=1 Tax=Ichthyophthirius multifiliis TaxID=5932 RepID=G0R5C8_ICHMU|nr:WD repeat protein [Ichthyophthirius multifiliis]EGR27317.1 WD repeat protein [Ichthyophthirius multifiliis]|eukprot:XP_004024201.1 WD repeat protein [Ichthyophthirius multifiliis]
MDKYGVLNFNLSDQTHPQMKLQFVVLCFLFGIQVTVGLSIPFLFYHPQSLMCKIENQWQSCTEQQMCQNKYEYKYNENEHYKSISMEFNLLCGQQKLQESAMLSFSLIGQVVGYLLNMLFEIPKPHKAKMLFFTVIIEFFWLCSVKVVVLNAFFLTIVLFGWNLLFAFYFGQQYAYICDVYSATINNVAPVALGFIQPFFGLFYLWYANSNGNWKDHLVNFTAIPLLIFGIMWFYTYDYRNDQNEVVKQEKSRLARIDTNNFITELFHKYAELITQPKLLNNTIMYLVTWVTSCLAYTSSFLVFNDIRHGSFLQNLLISQFFDVFGAFLAWIFVLNFPTRNVMFISSIIAGFIQVFTIGVGDKSSYLIEMGPIVMSKYFKSIIVGGLLIVVPQLMPYRYLVLLFTLSNMATLGLSAAVPFYKMLMDELKINIFVVFGVLAFVGSYYIRKWTYKEDLGITESQPQYVEGQQGNQMTQAIQGGIQPIRGKTHKSEENREKNHEAFLPGTPKSSKQPVDGHQSEKPKVVPISRSQRIDHVQGTDITIENKYVLGNANTKIFSVKFDHEDKYVACACENGEIRIFNTKSGKLSYTFFSSRPNIPFSYVRWRPQGQSQKTRNVFVSLSSEGEIQHFHLASGKLLSLKKVDSFDPQLYCMDYNINATNFAVCGSEPIIRVYDEETREQILKLGGDQMSTSGHSSRVFCIKYDKEDYNILYTGGWDFRVVIWDVREKKALQKGIYGPLICGDGIDLNGNYILTSSWTETNQLQIWDRRTYKLVSDIDWDVTLKSNAPVFLYAGQFSKDEGGTFILAGGSNTNEVKLFDRDNQNKAFCCITEFSKEVDTVDFGNKGELFATAGGDGLCRIFKMNM